MAVDPRGEQPFAPIGAVDDLQDGTDNIPDVSGLALVVSAVMFTATHEPGEY